MRTIQITLLALLTTLMPVGANASADSSVDPTDLEAGDEVLLMIETPITMRKPLSIFGEFKERSVSQGTITIQVDRSWDPDNVANLWRERQQSLRKGAPISIPAGMGALRQTSAEEAEMLVELVYETFDRGLRFWQRDDSFDTLFANAQERVQTFRDLGLDLTANTFMLYNELAWVADSYYASGDDSLQDRQEKLAAVRNEATVDRVRTKLREAGVLDSVREILSARLHYARWDTSWEINPPDGADLPGSYLVDRDERAVRITALESLGIQLLRRAAIVTVEQAFYAGDPTLDHDDPQALAIARTTFTPYIGLITNDGRLLPEEQSVEERSAALVDQEVGW